MDETTVSRGAKNMTWPFHRLRRVEVGSRVPFTRANFLAMGRAMRGAAEVLPGNR